MTRLERMRWWHVSELLPVERELFAPEPWSERLFWSELGQLDTRHYVVALDGEQVVGYAGLCDYPDEAFVQTMAVAPPAQGQGLGARLLVALLLDDDGLSAYDAHGLAWVSDHLGSEAVWLGRLDDEVHLRSGERLHRVQLRSGTTLTEAASW